MGNDANRLLFALPPAAADSCACCAGRGEYSFRTRKIIVYTISELEHLRIAEINLYTNVAYPERLEITGKKPVVLFTVS